MSFRLFFLSLSLFLPLILLALSAGGSFVSSSFPNRIWEIQEDEVGVLVFVRGDG